METGTMPEFFEHASLVLRSLSCTEGDLSGRIGALIRSALELARPSPGEKIGP